MCERPAMEMEAGSVVVFSRKDQPPTRETEGGERVPYAPRAIGVGSGDEIITGIYLENNVVLRRGERTIRAERIYYDLINHKALLIKPVMRTVQERRNMPIIVRADKAHQLSEREIVFYDAKISTSDFNGHHRQRLV